jgi:hypothetical protein
MIWTSVKVVVLSDPGHGWAISVGHTDVKKKKKSNRTVLVFASLFFTLTITSALLLALAPAPLAPATFSSLFAVDSPGALDVVFNTKAPLAQWKYIYIHHSQTPDGNAATLTRDHILDHFVIGNGDGCVDGEIQITQRWNNQYSITTPPPGIRRIDPACLSICLIGDFDQTRPTAIQQQRLAQLLKALQTRLSIPSSSIYTVNLPASPAGIGRFFSIDSPRAAETK